MRHIGAALLPGKCFVGVQQRPLTGAHIQQRHRACRRGKGRSGAMWGAGSGAW